MAKLKLPTAYGDVHTGIVELLESARRAAARSVNALMTASYWEIGRRIVEFEQGGKGRAEYGQQLLKRLSADLTARFGRGFGVINLQQMRNFYLFWPQEQIYQTPSDKSLPTEILQTPSAKSSPHPIRQTPSGQLANLATLATRFPLPWSAYVRLLSVKSEAARAFYETEALRCGWSVRQLDRQIGSQFYERVALSKNKAAILKKRESAGGPHPLRRQGRGRGALCPRQPAQQDTRRRIPDPAARRETDRRGVGAVAAGVGGTTVD